MSDKPWISDPLSVLQPEAFTWDLIVPRTSKFRSAFLAWAAPLVILTSDYSPASGDPDIWLSGARDYCPTYNYLNLHPFRVRDTNNQSLHCPGHRKNIHRKERRGWICGYSWSHSICWPLKFAKLSARNGRNVLKRSAQILTRTLVTS